MSHDKISAENPPQTHSPVSRSAGRRRSDRIIGVSPAMQQAVQSAATAAKSDLPVCLGGPEGSGREFLANAIHTWSNRDNGPFLVLTASALPEALQAREIFGCSEAVHRLLPAAYDGALKRASGGTLILDDVSALRKDVRNELLETLGTRQFSPQGSNAKIPLDARVIALAKRDAEDFFQDVPCLRIELSPLAKRREDILPLAAHFLSVFAEDLDVAVSGFTAEARQALLDASWPGNVEELRECIHQAVLLTRGGPISAEALCVARAPKDIPSFKEAKRAFELRYVQNLLTRCHGNISSAARFAKKDRKDFYDVIRRTGVDPREFRS